MSRVIGTRVEGVVEGSGKGLTHIFGGPHKHKGTTPKGCQSPLHLLYTFDTTAPAFPVQIPGVRYLPLYYSFRYNAGACGYRVKSQREIEILYMETKRVEPNFPYENYPAEFPKRRVRLHPISYEDHKTLVYAVVVEANPSAEDRKLVYDKFRYPFTQLGGIHFMLH